MPQDVIQILSDAWSVCGRFNVVNAILRYNFLLTNYRIQNQLNPQMTL